MMMMMMMMMTGASVRWERAVTPTAKRCTVIAFRKESGTLWEWESEIRVITVYYQWMAAVTALRRACCVAAFTAHKANWESQGAHSTRLVTWATLCKAARTISAAFYNVFKC